METGARTPGPRPHRLEHYRTKWNRPYWDCSTEADREKVPRLWLGVLFPGFVMVKSALEAALRADLKMLAD